MGLVVFIVECAAVVIMKDNGWEMVEDVVDVVVFVKLWVGWLVICSSSIENSFVVCISSWELTTRSGPRMSMSPPLTKIMSYSKMLASISLSTWVSMTCEM